MGSGKSRTPQLHAPADKRGMRWSRQGRSAAVMPGSSREELDKAVLTSMTMVRRTVASSSRFFQWIQAYSLVIWRIATLSPISHVPSCTKEIPGLPVERTLDVWPLSARTTVLSCRP